ncbi:uncharacterized protein Z518_01107 [Rhinocladiella mackenziei CBS 650.93]|uniref:Uncharacterized protein n=1 Tax=Rhinocladiella mackenziei CBS 650.93 TaxID=1442369 RepID=A0A0D2J314_9EURO|nr:uncharacterized protein Z518_01107 [Rhinocladiella mackenziei CBS 650.93]KIX10026.1 hypothetical protein Z518_01107 [Rhinocladiella mackenziei CBS 650.93]
MEELGPEESLRAENSAARSPEVRIRTRSEATSQNMTHKTRVRKYEHVLFQGQTFVVTGGGSGIGLAITLTLCDRGATVWTPELSPNPPEELKPLIERGTVHFKGDIDVASRTACKAFMDDVIATSGRLDGLVNNAGIGLTEGPIASDDAFDRMVDVNLKGTWNYGTQALQIMQNQEPRGPWASRGNIASGAGLRGVSCLAVYCATKHALIGLARSWALDFGSYGIRVNAVAPGITETPAFVKRVREEEGFLDTLPSNPINRYGKPSEIAASVSFLLSDESSYVTGDVLAVSGGS